MVSGLVLIRTTGEREFQIVGPAVLLLPANSHRHNVDVVFVFFQQEFYAVVRWVHVCGVCQWSASTVGAVLHDQVYVFSVGHFQRNNVCRTQLVMCRRNYSQFTICCIK